MQPDPKPQNVKSRTAPEYRQAWENFDAERGMLSSGAPITIETPTAARLPFGAHRSMAPRVLAELNLESRPGWLVRLCDLGQQCWGVGVIGEHGPLNDSDILYSVVSAIDRHRLELELGKNLDRIFDDGTPIEVISRGMPLPKSLLWFATLEEPRKYTVGASCYGDEATQRLSEQHKARAAFAVRREAALQLRRRWSISEMTSRESWPVWLPDWVRQIIRAGNQAWKELPNDPLNPSPAAPPPPPPQPTPRLRFVSTDPAFGGTPDKPVIVGGEVEDRDWRNG